MICVLQVGSSRDRLSFSQNPGSCRGETRDLFWWRTVFTHSCSTDEHWAQGFGLGKGRRGQSVEVGSGIALMLGVGRMLHSGCCLALKSHLVFTLSSRLQGGWRTGGRGWWDGLDFGYGGMWLARWAPWNMDPSHTKCLLSFVSGRTSFMTLERNLFPSIWILGSFLVFCRTNYRILMWFNLVCTKQMVS